MALTRTSTRSRELQRAAVAEKAALEGPAKMTSELQAEQDATPHPQ